MISNLTKTIKIFLGALVVGLVFARFGAVNTYAAPSLSLEFSPNPALPQSQFTLTAIIKDDGAGLSNVTLDINYPKEATTPVITAEGGFLCSLTRSRTSFSGQCKGGQVPPGGQASIQFVGNTPYLLYPSISLRASATLNPGNVSAYVSLQVVKSLQPDLGVTTQIDKTTVYVGDNVTYTVKVNNIGAFTTPPTTLEAVLPNGLVSRHQVDSLAIGAFKTFTFNFTPTQEGLATAKFTVDPDNLIDEGTYEFNNSVSPGFTAVVTLPDLTVNLVSSPTTVNLGNSFSKTISVSNNGTKEATNISLRDTFTGIEVIYFVSDHGFICQKEYNRIRGRKPISPSGYSCTGGTLLPGESTNISITMKATSIGTITSNVYVDRFNAIVESNETNNSLSHTITIVK